MQGYLKRIYPHGSLRLAALDQDRWLELFSASQRVALYWPLSGDLVTVLGYYDTVSDANAAAAIAVGDTGQHPRIAVNWGHSDFTHRNAGTVIHRDATVDLPAWYDEEPAS